MVTQSKKAFPLLHQEPAAPRCIRLPLLLLPWSPCRGQSLPNVGLSGGLQESSGHNLHCEVVCHQLNSESDSSREILELKKLSEVAAHQHVTASWRATGEGYLFPKKGKVNLYGIRTPTGSTATVQTHIALASLTNTCRREETRQARSRLK